MEKPIENNVTTYVSVSVHVNYSEYENIIYSGIDKDKAVKKAQEEANGYFDGKSRVYTWVNDECVSTETFFDQGQTYVREFSVYPEWETPFEDNQCKETLSTYLGRNIDIQIVTNSKIIHEYCDGSVFIEGEYSTLIEEARKKGFTAFDILFEVE